MKPAARACWRASLALAAAAVLACGCAASRDGEEASSLHLAEARVLVQPGGSLTVPQPSQLDADVPVGDWRSVTLPHTWPRAVIPQGGEADQATQTTWVAFDLDRHLDRHLGSAGTVPRGAYFYLPRWQTIGRIAVYADDRLIYRSTGDLVWNGFNHPLWLPIDADGGAPPHTLLLRIDSVASAGGAVSSAWVGPAAALEPQFQLRRLLQARISEVMSVAVMGLGLFALVVWLRRRHERVYLLFALYTLFMVLRGLHYHMGLEPLPIPTAWFGWMTVNAVNALLVTWYFFVATLVPQAPRWPGRALLGLMLLACLVTLPVLSAYPWIDALAPLSYLVTILSAVPAVLMMAWAAWRNGSREGVLASCVGVIDLPVAVHDWLMQNYWASPEDLYLWPVSTTARLLVFIYIILQRYVGAVEEVERANVRLAHRLREREAELAVSYGQLREVQQRETLTRERQRLMQDIHDGMGSQLMSALKVAESGRLSESQMTGVLRECIDDLRLTVDSLEPVEADLLLLLATLRYRLTPRLEGSGLALRWEVADVPPLEWLDPRSALHVLRILQEGIANVIRHARATELRVGTGLAEGGVVVHLQDNGQGFASPPDGEAGKGLSNMRRRARAIGGEVTWEALAGGTRFVLWLPLVQGASREAPRPLQAAVD
ncbi:ATP-binding protein [Variovorax sp. LT2P21]|uniref:sensor histidine kinase n=1 Tax=Variovorax sp. LT2P21 TaxID=3443731 RepID=UPI003F451D47